MANNKNNEKRQKAARPAAEGKKEYSTADKVKYYEGRVNDTTLSDGQRRFAANRLADIKGGKTGGASGKASQRRTYGGGYNGSAQSYTVTVTPRNNNYGGKK